MSIDLALVSAGIATSHISQDIAGVSLLAPCSFRLRRKNGTKWDRETISVEPRSVYLMTGPARTDWEHSIPPVAEHRYSITLRTMRPLQEV